MNKLPSLRKLLMASATVIAAFLPVAEAVAQCLPHMPLASLYVTSNFGNRKHPKLAGVTRLHGGIDLRAAIGTPVFAAEGGMATQRTGPSSSAGNTVTILTTSGKTLSYFHNNRLFVRAGDTIVAGQQIAQSGNTGNASAAPHLHFEVAPPSSPRVDPRPYLCNPAEKPGAGPDPSLNPGAPGPGAVGAAPTTNGIPNNDYHPMGPTAQAATALPNISSMPTYDDMTVQEFLATESTRRFGNPQWYRDLQDPLDALRNHPDPQVRDGANQIPVGDPKPMIWNEIMFMMNLRDFYALETRDRRERIEEMMASDLADRINIYSAQLLNALRNQATQLKPR